jgi:hypothetical protein
MVDTVDEVVTEETTDTATTDNTATGTVLGDGAQSTTTTDTAATTVATTAAKPEPTDWATIRTEIAGGDEKLLKQLSRYGTMKEAIKAGIEARAKLSQTRSEAKPGKDATPEELAAYRAANGIPESADKYEISLPDGLVIGEDDAPFVEGFKQTAHELNLTTEQVNKLAAAQLALKDKEVQARTMRDLETKEQAAETLRSPDEWGSEVKLNISLINGFLDTAPAGVKDLLLGARLGDGTPLGNHVGVLKFLASTAREINPMATVVPGSGSNAQQAMESEMADIEKMMANQKSDYWKGPKAAKLQARYRELTEIKLRMAKK